MTVVERSDYDSFQTQSQLIFQGLGFVRICSSAVIVSVAICVSTPPQARESILSVCVWGCL